jgi:hypothetical protein
MFTSKFHTQPFQRPNLRLQVKPTQLGPIDRASPYLRTRDLSRYIYIYIYTAKNLAFQESPYISKIFTRHYLPSSSCSRCQSMSTIGIFGK